MLPTQIGLVQFPGTSFSVISPLTRPQAFKSFPLITLVVNDPGLSGNWFTCPLFSFHHAVVSLSSPLSHMSFFSKDVKGHLFYHIRGTFLKFMLYLLREGYHIFLHTHNVAFSKMDLSKQRQLFHARILLSPIHLQILPHQDTGPWFVLT